MKNLKCYCVSIDGPDKVGKGTILSYLSKMGGRYLNLLDRGPITNIVWNKIQGRDIAYDLTMWRNTLFVKLTADKEDWEIRCKINDEPPLPEEYEKHVKAYDAIFNDFKIHGFYVIEFNTSKMTAFKISKKIIEKLNEINGKGNEI